MKTALFTFIVDRSSNGRTPAAGRRSQAAGRRPQVAGRRSQAAGRRPQVAGRSSQAASDSDAAARQQIQNNNIASSDPWLVNLPRPGPP